MHRLLSPALHDAQQRGHGSIETLALPYVYADIGLDSPYCYNPLHNDLEPYALRPRHRVVVAVAVGCT